ncbi:PREDICTED: ubiquitin-conjugating enzyme E2 variant 3-like [Lipotes vexillifer]|uniref:Ubiquitin-conjugating enzyme E2 variant 3-like n=1 Tax=Lipotes vexillifer TaxID=118797 RepID=A0A340WLB9_LIPVE|nr:PREDICTED: ubiquitin-conjugating enzyme E2 variant 3-like [Lipotes vexillifer]
MELNSEGVRRLLGKYKFRDLTMEELKNVNMFFPHFRYSMDTYVFKDSSQKNLLNFTGTIPVMYQGASGIHSKNWAKHENKTVNKITVVGGGELGIACTLAISAKVVIFTVNSLGSSQAFVAALGHYSPHGILLVASQPVEIMTYVTWKLSAFPANRVIGIGCNLDSQRLQYIITNVLKTQTSAREVWVIGEQGEDKASSSAILTSILC